MMKMGVYKNMLTWRQSKEFITLIQNKNDYTKSSEFITLYFISARTLQNDLNAIRFYIKPYECSIENIPSKGYQLHITDQNKFDTLYQEILNNYQKQYSFNEQQSRIQFILSSLISSNGYILSQKLANHMYISKSRLSSDLNGVRKILAAYDLELLSKPHYGIMIYGREEDKRRCIIKQNIAFEQFVPDTLLDNNSYGHSNFPKVKEIVTEALISEKFIVSDVVFQNIVIHISTSLFRMKHECYVKGPISSDKKYIHAIEIARKIMHECCKEYQIAYSEEESQLLALSLQGKREYNNQEYISNEINDFIFHSLQLVRQKYGINFINDLNLRISLGLHLIPLIIRLQTNMQLPNIMKYDIKQKYVMAYDIASFFAYQISLKYNKRLTDDEISYIAIHFSVSLNSMTEWSGQKRILLISSEKKSNTILIWQKINQWFSQDISTFDIIGINQISSSKLSDYDAVLTTDKNVPACVPAVHINFFLTDKDFNKIELAINGFKSPQDILSRFDESMFFCKNYYDKTAIIKKLCDQSKIKYKKIDELFNSVFKHEDVSNSYFGNFVAMPHPDILITDCTFISVGIIPNGVKWGTDEEVKLVLLVSIEKDNFKAYTIWYYLSFIISNAEAIEEIISKPTYANFYHVVEKFYTKIFSNS